MTRSMQVGTSGTAADGSSTSIRVDARGRSCFSDQQQPVRRDKSPVAAEVDGYAVEQPSYDDLAGLRRKQPAVALAFTVQLLHGHRQRSALNTIVAAITRRNQPNPTLSFLLSSLTVSRLPICPPMNTAAARTSESFESQQPCSR